MTEAVPGYLPASVRPHLAWARRHVARVAARYAVGLDDLWDEAISALLRVSVSSEPWAQTKKHGALVVHQNYARTAVSRACWRYVGRRLAGKPRHVAIDRTDKHRHAKGGHDEAPAGRVPHEVHDLDADLEWAWASAEDEVMAREAAYLRGVAGELDVAQCSPGRPAAGRARGSARG